MNQPRASRLSRPGPARETWLSKNLPSGSMRRTVVLGIAVPVVTLIILLLIFDKIVMPTVTRQGSEFPLPDFVGQRMLEAQLSIDELNLSYEISSEQFSPGKPQGTILQQFPMPGTKVKPDRKIRFIVSRGQKMVAIPDLAGKSVRQAMLDLESYDLELGEIALAYSDTIPERVVVFSYPAAGSEIPAGSPVNLMVNRGRASNFTFMPKVIGMTLDEAARLLEDKYLKLGLVSYRTDENYLPETVLEQSEPEGAELDTGTEIDLVVSAN